MIPSYLSRARKIVDNYLLSRVLSRPSTARYWYLPEPPRVYDSQTFQAYLTSASPAPFYLVDYSRKLAYPYIGEAGIIVLHYDKPIGAQVNPEAAFQYALGVHDVYLECHEPAMLKQFLSYADYFLEHQSPEGRWYYHFDWYGSRAPWSSALAQSRGVSVMLRAWMQTKRGEYLESARKALSSFEAPIDSGGYARPFPATGCLYFEEYPQEPKAVLNGFMASLFGIWELAHWANDSESHRLWRIGRESLKQMLPYYTLRWSTLYDLDARIPMANVNSPRYHLLITSYLAILARLDPDPVFTHYLGVWRGQNTALNRVWATLWKLVYKVRFR